MEYPHFVISRTQWSVIIAAHCFKKGANYGEKSCVCKALEEGRGCTGPRLKPQNLAVGRTDEWVLEVCQHWFLALDKYWLKGSLLLPGVRKIFQPLTGSVTPPGGVHILNVHRVVKGFAGRKDLVRLYGKDFVLIKQEVLNLGLKFSECLR